MSDWTECPNCKKLIVKGSMKCEQCGWIMQG